MKNIKVLTKTKTEANVKAGVEITLNNGAILASSTLAEKLNKLVLQLFNNKDRNGLLLSVGEKENLVKPLTNIIKFISMLVEADQMFVLRNVVDTEEEARLDLGMNWMFNYNVEPLTATQASDITLSRTDRDTFKLTFGEMAIEDFYRDVKSLVKHFSSEVVSLKVSYDFIGAVDSEFHELFTGYYLPRI